MTEPDPHCEACPFIACLGCNYQTPDQEEA